MNERIFFKFKDSKIVNIDHSLMETDWIYIILKSPCMIA